MLAATKEKRQVAIQVAEANGKRTLTQTVATKN
jgi:hypothetical protein